MRAKFAMTAVALAVALGGITLGPAAQAADHRSSVAPMTKASAGFNVGGIWTIYQSNSSNATLSVTQDAQGRLTGIARSGSTTTGTIEGFVDGTYLSFVISWSDGAKGRYIGSRGSDGRLSGVTTDLTHPTSQATWYTTWSF
ncbi:hypothetical protein SAMN05428945_3404 [Streptomyces sp. 2224.1]|uniref:hypothetical protein n=1 Tax=unclassified Streptomyces TaxID=2593676 RepID=UPI00089C3DF9|nr:MULTISPECIES: hypothetical protein [unclassified Streptomyces]SEC62295.1 hypothetical protein SAMN05428945_3404 [Streptomyces sp. 2224.1]SEF02542.1 hypothetical protein SAMN05428954_5350 [Streptomyces sp. 2112.3]